MWIRQPLVIITGIWCCTAQWHRVILCYHCGDRWKNVSRVRLVHPVIHCKYHCMIDNQIRTGFVRRWCEHLFPLGAFYIYTPNYSSNEVVFVVVKQIVFCEVPYLGHKNPSKCRHQPWPNDTTIGCAVTYIQLSLALRSNDLKVEVMILFQKKALPRHHQHLGESRLSRPHQGRQVVVPTSSVAHL